MSVIRYKCWVKLIDSKFYTDETGNPIEVQVLDRRVMHGNVEYLVDLTPARWISEKKLVTKTY